MCAAELTGITSQVLFDNPLIFDAIISGLNVATAGTVLAGAGLGVGSLAKPGTLPGDKIYPSVSPAELQNIVEGVDLRELIDDFLNDDNNIIPDDIEINIYEFFQNQERYGRMAVRQLAQLSPNVQDVFPLVKECSSYATIDTNVCSHFGDIPELTPVLVRTGYIWKCACVHKIEIEPDYNILRHMAGPIPDEIMISWGLVFAKYGDIVLDRHDNDAQFFCRDWHYFYTGLAGPVPGNVSCSTLETRLYKPKIVFGEVKCYADTDLSSLAAAYNVYFKVTYSHVYMSSDMFAKLSDERLDLNAVA